MFLLKFRKSEEFHRNYIYYTLTHPNFKFDLTNIREYFSNFSFDIVKLKENNRIVPVYDFDLIIDLYAEILEINPSHHDYIGGFIFNYITFKISEFTLDDKDNTINHRTLHEFKIYEDKFSRYVKRLHLKANREYEFNFFDDITQRVINHRDEKYEVNINFWLRFYYTTDKDRVYDEETSWV